ncbi:MAG: hypothetical protein VXV96_18320 [Bdellovibrionota bacterium]|nr:hypothetical protein [Bdellovibrionota bacterium]
MKTLLALVVGLFLTTNAHAISLTFKLDIFSSGSDIYACNAGLMHQGYEGRVCYERDNTEQSCNPLNCKDGEACNCVCTGDTLNNSGQGEYRLDYLNATYRNWADHGETSSVGGAANKEAGLTNFNQVFDNNQAFGKELSSLTFNLGSERYGAVYFLDVCFRATQISYDYAGSTINWAHDKQVTITDLSPGYNYEELSGLKVKAVVKCKAKGENWFTKEVTDWKYFNNSDVINYSKYNITKDLEKCKVRYLFKEGNRNGLASLRRWNLQKARVCTYTSFDEPAAQ